MLVAVYGSLRKGLHNYKGKLDKSQYVGSFDTLPIYTLFSLGSFPGLLKEGHTAVRMEVFKINDTTLKLLDALEGFNGTKKANYYNREEITTPYGKAYTYFYANKEDARNQAVVETGDWKEFLQTQQLYANV